MPRPVLVFRHARNSALIVTILIVGAALAAVAPEQGFQRLGPVTNVAMSTQTMTNRAEYHPYYARMLGHRMTRNFGWRSTRQWRCLRQLWNLESSWRVHANNPNNSAYGIPQALPGSKMSSAGSHWRRNAQTQIRWGLRYVHGRYSAPCGALRHKDRTGWY